MIALPWKKLCANFILPCGENHYGFFLRCPTSFYNRPKLKDFNPNQIKDYFLKLSEETGELARAIRKNLKPTDDIKIKETVAEELWDVIYYAIAIANCYHIDLEKVIPQKEKLNNDKYNTGIEFNPAK